LDHEKWALRILQALGLLYFPPMVLVGLYNYSIDFLPQHCAFHAGLPASLGINLFTALQIANVTLAVAVVGPVYAFNHYYLRRRFGHIIRAEETRDESKNIVNFRTAVIGLFVVGLTILSVMVFQLLPGLDVFADFPFIVPEVCVMVTLVNGYFALKPGIKGYFVRHVNQRLSTLEFRLPFLFKRSKVYPVYA